MRSTEGSSQQEANQGILTARQYLIDFDVILVAEFSARFRSPLVCAPRDSRAAWPALQRRRRIFDRALLKLHRIAAGGHGNTDQSLGQIRRRRYD